MAAPKKPKEYTSSRFYPTGSPGDKVKLAYWRGVPANDQGGVHLVRESKETYVNRSRADMASRYGDTSGNKKETTAKKKKKTTSMLIDETKVDSEKAKTEKAAQTRDLTNKIVEQLKSDMNSGAVVQADSVNQKGKHRNWLQRNIADNVIGDTARSVQHSVVGDVAGKAIDVLSRPASAFSGFVQSAIEKGAPISADPLTGPSATRDPKRDPDYKNFTPEQKANADALYAHAQELKKRGPLGAASDALSGKKKFSFADLMQRQIAEATDYKPPTTAAKIYGVAAGLATDVVTDPLNVVGVGVARGVAKTVREARTAENVIQDVSNVARETAAARSASKELVLASEATQTPWMEQLAGSIENQGQHAAALDAQIAERTAQASRNAADIRSATEGGYKALKAETLKQARRVASLEAKIKRTGGVTNALGAAINDELDGAKALLAQLNARYDRITKIREVATSAPVGEDVVKLAKQVEDLKTIAKVSPNNTVVAARLKKASEALKVQTALARNAKIANIPNHADEILKMVEDLNAGKEVNLTRAAKEAVVNNPSVQDHLLALMKENESQFTKNPNKVQPSNLLLREIDKAAENASIPTHSPETISQAAQIVSDSNASRSAHDMAKSILDNVELRGRAVTSGEQNALVAQELFKKMGETGVQDAALARTSEKVANIRAAKGPLSVSSELKASLFDESLAEEILPTKETMDKILANGLQKRFMIHVGGSDLGNFKPIGQVLRAAYMPFELTGRHIGATGAGQSLAKAFKMGAHFPGFTEDLRSMAESHGIVEHADWTLKVRKALTNEFSKDEMRQVTKAIEGGYKLEGRLGEAQAFAQEKIHEIFVKQSDIGKYPPGAEADNYVYHYYRKGARDKIKAFKDDRTALLREGKKGPTIEAAKAAGLKPMDSIDDMLVMQHRDFIRDLQRSNFRQGVVDNYGVLTDNAAFAKQLGLTEVKGGSLNKPFIDLAQAKGPNARWYLPPDVHKTFDAMDRMMEIGVNREANQIMDFYAKATRYFKTSATVGAPSNWVNNTLGDFFLNYMDGVRNPLWYKRAVGLLRTEGTEFPRTVSIAGRDLSGIDVVDIFKRQAPSGGFIRTEGSALGRSRLVRGVQNAYEAREESVRLAHFLHALDEETRVALRKGLGYEKALDVAGERAARRVAHWNIDYSGITPFERQVRKWAIPFYTFMRKATPLMFEGMVTRPGKLVHYDMAKRATEQMLGLPKQEDDGIAWPFWALQAGMTRLTKGDEPMFMKDPSPLSVVNRVLGGDQYTDPLANVVNQANPLAKMPIEIAQQRTLFNQQPITNWGEYLLGQIPTAQIASRASGTQLNPGSSQTPDRSGAEQVANLFGIPIQRMTFNRQRGQIIRDTKDKGYTRDVNAELKGYEIKKAHSTTKGDYYNIKDLKTGEIIAKFRDYNMAARRATALDRGTP